MNPRVIVLHTTESTGWPSYSAGQVPHLTGRVDEATHTIGWRQHLSFNRNARALLNRPGGIETNNAGALQIELCGTSGWANRPGGYGAQPAWPEASDWMLREVAQMVAWLAHVHGIPLVAPPQGFGTWANGVRRFSPTEWLAFGGVCGHQHVPENEHTDPGLIDIVTILRYAGAITTTAAAPASVNSLAVDGILGRRTIAAIQRWLGVTADGMVGPLTRRALQAKLGVTVDGIWGRRTNTALQRLVGATPDGIWGPQTTRALQRYLNRIEA